MRTFILTLILISCFFPQKSCGQTILGKVLNNKDNEEIFFAPIYLIKNGQVIYKAKTNVDGGFAFYKINPGQYKLFLPCNNCKQDTMLINLAIDSTINITHKLTCDNSICNYSDPAEATVKVKNIKVYTSLKKALKHPEKVVALDLRGQDINELSPEIGKLKNLEFLWLSSKLRNLWFYPKAWPYKFFGKQLPAGGYAHLQGRGRGKFYNHNHLKTLPKEILELTSLKVIDICENNIKPDDYLQKLRIKNQDIILLSYEYDPWVIVDAEFDKYKVLTKTYKFK